MSDFDIGGLASLLATAGDIVNRFISERAKREANLKENVFMGVDLIKELTHNHMKAIDLVVTPILEKNDLLSTSDNYRKLVNDQSFPRGYGEAKGIFEAALYKKPFNKGSLSDTLKNINTQLTYFQFAAFILRHDSNAMADQFDMASTLWTHLHNRNKQNTSPIPNHLRNQVYGSFRHSIEWIFSEQGKGIPTMNTKSIENTEDLIIHVKQWCLEWQRFVKQTLYGGRNLDYYIGILETERRRS